MRIEQVEVDGDGVAEERPEDVRDEEHARRLLHLARRREGRRHEPVQQRIDRRWRPTKPQAQEFSPETWRTVVREDRLTLHHCHHFAKIFALSVRCRASAAAVTPSAPPPTAPPGCGW